MTSAKTKDVSEPSGETHTQTETPLNIYQRINYAGRILRENPWIKDMSNSQYKSVDIDQIRHYVGDAETEAGIVVEYIEEEFGTMEANGKVLAKIRAKLVYTNIDDPDDIIVYGRTAVAFDSLDKGWNKADSMLFKNHYKALYHIGEREDDPDSMSNEEHEILEAVRGDRNVRDAIMVIVNNHLSGIREAAKKAEEQARIERRMEMAKGAASFMERKKPSESRGTEQMRQTILTVIKDKDRPQLAETFNRYRAEFGLFRNWSDEIVGRCYNEVVAQAGEVRE